MEQYILTYLNRTKRISDVITVVYVEFAYSLKLDRLIGYFRLFIVATDAPRRRLVVTRDSSRIQDETTKSSARFYNVLGV